MLADPEEDGWERTDFPVVCEDCLGPNPYVRMQKQDYAAECAISGRPFTVFRWRPGAEARYKKTVVCREIALAKNVCQVCLLDLDYGIPVQARDAALGRDGNELTAKSDVNIEYQTEQIAKRLEAGEDVSGMLGGPAQGGAGGKSQRAHEILSKMARKKPYYNKNKAAICTFWLRDACTRADCPYRPCNGDQHMPELTAAPEMRKQNIKDRYYGTNDPVAEKMLKRATEVKKLEPPSDPNITTLFVGGLDLRVDEDALRGIFSAAGELRSIKCLYERNCAFVTFADRAGAEKAAGDLGAAFEVNGIRLKLMWGKPKAGGQGKAAPAAGGGGGGGGGGASAATAPPPMMMMMAPGAAPPPGAVPIGYAPMMMPAPYVPPGAPGAGPGARALYPSMDPGAMGARRDGGDDEKKRGGGARGDARRR